jgi:hypothetical protein
MNVFKKPDVPGQYTNTLLKEFLKYPDVKGTVSSVTALQELNHADVHAFKKLNRELFSLLELDIAGALNNVYHNNHYRALGLFISMLIQDVNLLDYCHPSIFKGKTGESASRLTAMVRQAMHAQGMRHGALPAYATALIGGLVGTIVVLLLLIAILALVTSNL